MKNGGIDASVFVLGGAYLSVGNAPSAGKPWQLLYPCGGDAGGEDALCYNLMMSPGTKELLEKVASWPAEDQQELAEVAAEIEARRTGRYAMTDDERTAVDNGLKQVRRGEFASDQEMDSFWKRFGVA
jgi:hypothetical protein